MTLRNLLVAYNGGPASDVALDHALMIAARHDAHLTGVLAHGASAVTKVAPGWLPMGLRASIDDMLAQRFEEIAAKFHDRVRGRLAEDHVHWMDEKGDPDMTVADDARLFDLCVLGQYENLPGADEIALHPDRIALASGRPVLIAPKDHPADHLPKRTVVAWDGGRCAARALFDALQILETGHEVIVATVDRGRARGTPLGAQAATILNRHDVPVEVASLPAKGRSVARTILDHCRDVDAGLLVMGAYQHSKITEDMFGGVTREVLETTHLPVLMSH